MRYLSLFSGIEAASVAWAPLGWKPFGFAEVDAAASAVLKHHHPDVPNFGDVTRFQEWPDGTVDVVCGGSPCQSFSVAGLRAGMADPRGNLALTFLAVVDRYRPTWVVYENVPGLLSSNGGRDFGSFLGGLVELGYGFAYRVLDAQHIRVDGYGRAVPQRRRRVFVVGYLGDWRRAAAVLLERACLRGDPAPRREEGQGTARCLTRGSGGGQRYDWETETFVAGCLNGLSEYGAEVPTLRAKGGDAAGGSEALLAHCFDARQSDVIQYGNFTGPLDTDGHTMAIAFSCKDHGADATDRGAAPTMRAMGHGQSHANAGGQLAVAIGHNGGPALSEWSVRRLTPTECERLQGFPDGYTLVPWRKGLMPDGPRYKMLGNSWAVNCPRWIGRRIQMVEALDLPLLQAAE